VTLQKRGHSVRESLIVKAINTEGPYEAVEAERESRFYESIHPALSIPKPVIHFLGLDESTGWLVIVMEDLATTQRIPRHPHQWSRPELESVLRAYARLHSSPFEFGDHAWLVPPHESVLDFEQIPEQLATVQGAGIWGDLPALPDLIACARESCRKYASAVPALLHGDTTPANSALPGSSTEPATLIDWQDVGFGLPEFDLAYLDLQPFESARGIPRPELLSRYWQFRAEIDPGLPSPQERRARQLHADLVTALWLIAPASRVALHPFPQETYPHMHWVSQYPIVYNRLTELGREISHNRA
jgi:aminoglycoside phosphotransferase (APT) family kinase protein